MALFLAPSAYIWGGVQTWLDQTSRGLSERGWEIRLGLVAGPRHHQPGKYASAHPGHSIVPVVCSTATHEGRVRAVLRTLRAVRPDLLVLVNIADGLEAARRWKTAAKAQSFRVAYTIHAFLPGQIADVASFDGTVDRVIATNRLMERALGAVLGEGIPVGYAPYGTEGPMAPHSPGGLPMRPLRLAWVGRMEEPQKRASDVVPILRRCRELGVAFTCDVVGDGPSGQSVRSGLESLEATGHVRYRGYLQRDDLYRSVYPGLDALLLTSTWETGPIVAWEAMRHGACLVSTRYTGLREEGALIDGENCLLAPVGDVEGLARAVGRLKSEEGLRDRLGREARILADRRYSLEASADAWNEQLLEALRAPRREAGLAVKSKRVAGRLDRWFGPSVAETLRELAGRVNAGACDPGDEWPHELHERAVPVEPIARRLEDLLRGDGHAVSPLELVEARAR